MLRVLMFEDLPEEIKREIFVRIRAVKYVVRSRCVCKSWNTLISSPCFVDAHHERNILMRSKTASRDYEYLLVGNPKNFSLFSAETYERCLDLELPATHDVPGSFLTVSGSCHGLLCISSYSHLTPDTPIYLWNPSIRKLRSLPDSLTGGGMRFYILFGFQPGKNDYKVVKINEREIGISSVVYQVEVYSLRLNSWRRINSEVPLQWFLMGGWLKQSVYLSGVIYSVVPEIHRSLSPVLSRCILAFDTCIEIFRKILLPELARRNARNSMVCIRVLEDALSVSRLNLNNLSTDIWVLEKDDTWNMHRTVPLPSENYISWPLGFAADGGVHVIRRMEKREGDETHESHLVLYDNKGCPVKEVETTGMADFVDAYTESLVLIC